jgi:hypothetical protein
LLGYWEVHKVLRGRLGIAVEGIRGNRGGSGVVVVIVENRVFWVVHAVEHRSSGGFRGVLRDMAKGV